MPADADMRPPALARMLADLLDCLDLQDVVLVGNDTGGAICQLLAVHHPERIGALVLTNCDAFENFYPPVLRPLQVAARLPGFESLLKGIATPRLARRLVRPPT